MTLQGTSGLRGPLLYCLLGRTTAMLREKQQCSLDAWKKAATGPRAADAHSLRLQNPHNPCYANSVIHRLQQALATSQAWVHSMDLWHRRSGQKRRFL